MCNNDPMVSLAEKRILSEKLITLQHVHFFYISALTIIPDILTYQRAKFRCTDISV